MSDQEKEQLQENKPQLSMSYFMADKVETPEIEIERIVSTRFKDAEGEVIPFIFRAINPDVMEEIEKSCEVPKKNHMGRKTGETKLDPTKYGRRIALASCTYPNFHDAALIKSYGATTPEKLLLKMLPIQGELNAFMEAGLEVNGIGFDPEDIRNEAKN